jgi:hypothetical protein
VLSGLALSAMLTALVAGIAGAWSPCGFSMVDTIGTALGDARRPATFVACTTFTVGAVLGGALTFGGLASVGELTGGPAGGVREALGAGLALAAAIADWRGVRIAPQIRRQVPERWRWTMPLPLACGLYGILLGLGFTTFVLAFAVWALAGISLAAASPSVGLLIGLAFGVGRALPVLWMAPGMRSGEGGQRLEEMAAEPRLWLGLRRLDALGLGLCALFLSGTAAAAAPLGSDPSAAGEQLVWQPPRGPGVLRVGSGRTLTLPGSYPAVSRSSIAWLQNGVITVARQGTLAVTASFSVGQANALALSDEWVVYRGQATGGSESLAGISLINPSGPRYAMRSRPAGQIGRPGLDGSTVVFTLNTSRRSAIEAMNLVTGARRLLRAAESGAAFANPSLLHGRLLYERIDRCAQQLRIGSMDSATHDRVLLSLPSTVRRDPGYQPGYEHNWNGASLCPGGGAGGGGTIRLGATAIDASAVFVTEIPQNARDAQILTLPG